MKAIGKRARFIGAVAVLVVLLTALWYFSPRTFLKGVDPAEIERVEVFSGTTGQYVTLTEPEKIVSLVGSIQRQSLRRGGISLGRMGYSYRLTFCNASGKVVEEFYLNSDTLIRSDPFFYVSNGDLGYGQIQNLF